MTDHLRYSMNEISFAKTGLAFPFKEIKLFSFPKLIKQSSRSSSNQPSVLQLVKFCGPSNRKPTAVYASPNLRQFCFWNNLTIDRLLWLPIFLNFARKLIFILKCSKMRRAGVIRLIKSMNHSQSFLSTMFFIAFFWSRSSSGPPQTHELSSVSYDRVYSGFHLVGIL